MNGQCIPQASPSSTNLVLGNPVLSDACGQAESQPRNQANLFVGLNPQVSSVKTGKPFVGADPATAAGVGGTLGRVLAPTTPSFACFPEGWSS